MVTGELVTFRLLWKFEAQRNQFFPPPGQGKTCPQQLLKIAGPFILFRIRNYSFCPSSSGERNIGPLFFSLTLLPDPLQLLEIIGRSGPLKIRSLVESTLSFFFLTGGACQWTLSFFGSRFYRIPYNCSKLLKVLRAPSKIRKPKNPPFLPPSSTDPANYFIALQYFLEFFIFAGLIRDNSQNYHVWLHVINCFPICTFIMWFTELYLWAKPKKLKKPIVLNRSWQLWRKITKQWRS